MRGDETRALFMYRHCGAEVIKNCDEIFKRVHTAEPTLVILARSRHLGPRTVENTTMTVQNVCDISESVTVVISASGVEKNCMGKWRQVDITRNIDRMENREYLSITDLPTYVPLWCPSSRQLQGDRRVFGKR